MHIEAYQHPSIQSDVNYTEVTFLIKPLDPWRDILIAELGDIGFDSFEETVHGVKAYVPSAQFRSQEITGLQVLRDPHVTITYTSREVEPRNWNALWESSFEPVEVGQQVRIRADFHPSDPGLCTRARHHPAHGLRHGAPCHHAHDGGGHVAPAACR